MFWRENKIILVCTRGIQKSHDKQHTCFEYNQ